MPSARHYGRARAEAMVAPLINKGDEKMAQAIGYVTETENGFTGQLAMMSLKKRITILPNSKKENDRQPDFRVYTEDKVEIGGGWNRVGKVSGNPYISLTFAAPEFGSRKIYANLGPASGQEKEGVSAILWNPED
jgi:uncharacterized protein (DUF736 family)